MSNFSNLMQVFADSADLDDPFIARARESILAPIREQHELRFFVDGTANCGHQAATVHMIRRIITMTQYTGRVTVVYADILPGGAFGRTPHKLALLMSGLDPREIDSATVTIGRCSEIRFLNYDRRAELADEAQFGFTAGADDMNINFARELNVKYFLRLQPYLWDDDASKKAERFYESSRIETAVGGYFYPVDDYPPFRAIPFKYAREDLAAVDDAVWDWYARDQTFDADLRVRTEKIREMVGRRPLWPVYGLHQFRDRLPQIMRNLSSAAAGIDHVMLLLNEGPVPGDVYNYLYATAALPGVFEGQNTSSLVISLGRPFLQIQRETSGIENPYPARIGGREFGEVAARANAASLELRDGAATPQAARFIADCQDPASDVSEYFRAMGEYYQKDIHDKLFAGLVALALAS